MSSIWFSTRRFGDGVLDEPHWLTEFKPIESLQRYSTMFTDCMRKIREAIRAGPATKFNMVQQRR